MLKVALTVATALLVACSDQTTDLCTPLSTILSEVKIDSGLVLFARVAPDDLKDMDDGGCAPLDARFWVIPTEAVVKSTTTARALFATPPPAKIEVQVTAQDEYGTVEVLSGPVAVYWFADEYVVAVTTFNLPQNEVVAVGSINRWFRPELPAESDTYETSFQVK